jgi:hypothetical protein
LALAACSTTPVIVIPAVFGSKLRDRSTGNINFQDNLLNVLLTRTLPWEMSAPAC